MLNPSITTNRLHFEDLDPRRFEELGFQLLQRLYKWDRLDHTGVSGNDGGIDIYGITKDGIHCYCQVKRYQKMSQPDIRKIYSSIVTNNKGNFESDAKFILICACDLSKQVLDLTYEEGFKYGFKSVEIISRTKLEGLLYNEHRALLKTFFGFDSNTKASIASKIRKQIRAKKNVLKKLIRKDLNKIPIETLVANPGIQFISDEFMLLSARSSLASTRYSEDVTYGKAWPLKVTDEGIELLLPFCKRIIFNVKSNTWYIANDQNLRLNKDEYELLSQAIGLLPFSQIADIEEDGDAYFSCPIIHCESEELINAFSKITAKYHASDIIFDVTRNLTPKEISLIHSQIETNLKFTKNG